MSEEIEKIEGFSVQIRGDDSEQFIHVKVGYETTFVHIPTALKSKNSDLKLALLDSLARERCSSKSKLTEIIERLVEGNLDLKYKNKNLRTEKTGIEEQLKESQKLIFDQDKLKKKLPWYKSFFKK